MGNMISSSSSSPDSSSDDTSSFFLNLARGSLVFTAEPGFPMLPLIAVGIMVVILLAFRRRTMLNSAERKNFLCGFLISWVGFFLSWVGILLAFIFVRFKRRTMAADSEVINTSDGEGAIEQYRHRIISSLPRLTDLCNVAPQTTGGIITILEREGRNGFATELAVFWNGKPRTIVDLMKAILGANLSFSVEAKVVDFAWIFRLRYKPLAEQLPFLEAVSCALREGRRLEFELNENGGVTVKEALIRLPRARIEGTIHNAAIEDYSDTELKPWETLGVKPFGTLSVKYLPANDLEASEGIDPYAELYIRPLIDGKKCMLSDGRLRWDKQYDVNEDPSTQQFKVTVLNKQDEETIGHAKFPLKELQPMKWTHVSAKLNLVKKEDLEGDESQAEVMRLMLFYCPFGEESSVQVDPRWLDYFRMEKPTFLNLLGILAPSLQSKLPPSIPPYTALAAALVRLSHALPYATVESWFRLDSPPEAARLAFFAVCESVCENKATLLSKSVQLGFERLPLPNCCGVLGFHRFKFDNSGVELGNEGSYLVQALVDSDGKFLDISTNWPGDMSPYSILKKSKLFSKLRRRQVPDDDDDSGRMRYIVGATCLPLLPWLLTPFHVTDEEEGVLLGEQQFNDIHNKAMKIHLDAFWRLKARWELLRMNWRNEEVRLLPSVILMGCALHNFLLKMEEPMPEGFRDLDSELAEEFPVYEGDDSDERGKRIRDKIAAELLGDKPQGI